MSSVLLLEEGTRLEALIGDDISSKLRLDLAKTCLSCSEPELHSEVNGKPERYF